MFVSQNMSVCHDVFFFFFVLDSVAVVFNTFYSYACLEMLIMFDFLLFFHNFVFFLIFFFVFLSFCFLNGSFATLFRNVAFSVAFHHFNSFSFTCPFICWLLSFVFLLLKTLVCSKKFTRILLRR